MIVKRGEERHPKASIRHRVEESMTRGGEKEIRPQVKSAQVGQAVGKRYAHCNNGNEGSK
jgi:hypothetical protein